MKGDKKRFIFKKVKCIIASESMETDIIEFKDSKQSLFSRGSIHSFIAFLEK